MRERRGIDDVRANLQFARNQVQGPTRRPGRVEGWLGTLSLNEWMALAAAVPSDWPIERIYFIIVLILGVSQEEADKIVNNRPYRVKGELVAKNVVAKETFDQIKERITISQ